MTKKKNKNKKPFIDFFREGISDATGRNEKDISNEEIIESIKNAKEIDNDGNEINMVLDIQIKEHNIVPNQKVIEISEGNKLIATIIPRITTISIVSNYIKNIKSIEKDMNLLPQKIILNLKKRKNHEF